MKHSKKKRVRSCGNKVKYDSLEAAKVVMYALLRKNDFTETLEAYHCGSCKKYHYGHRRSNGYRNMASMERVMARL